MKTALLLLIPLLLTPCFATRYGRNKVQTEDRDWWEIQGRYFTIYFPRGGEAAAESLLVHTERELLELSEEFNYMPSEPIPIVLYISPGTFRQTDINPYEISQAVGGFTEFYKGRVVIPFTGYWSEFRHVVDHELNHAFVYDMLYNRTLLNIITGGTPLWMMEGLAEYTSLGWDAASEAEFRDMVIANQIVSIGELSRRSDYLVYRQGQAIYHFINERYGPQKYREFVRHINAQSAKNFAPDRNESAGRSGEPGDLFDSVFGMSMEQFSEKFIEWARETYWPELACKESPDDIANAIYRDNERIWQLNTVVSDDGDLIAGVEYHHAHFAVTVRSAVTGEVMYRPFVSGGVWDRSVSPMYRVCDFSSSGDSLVVAVQNISGDRLCIYTEDTRYELPVEMDLIRDPAWSPDGRYIGFAGMNESVLDLYVYDLRSDRLTRLTETSSGERDLSWNGSSILASVEDGPGVTEVVEYSLDGSATQVYRDSAEVRYPMQSRDGLIFLSNETGFPDLYMLDRESGDKRRITALYRTMRSPSLADSSGIVTFVSTDWNGAGVFVAHDIQDRRVSDLSRGSLCVENIRDDASETGPSSIERSPDKMPFPLHDAAGIRDAATGSESAGEVDTAEVNARCGLAPYSPRLTVDYASANAAYDSYLGVAGYTQFILSDVLAHHQVVVNTNLNGGSLSDVDVAAYYGYLPNREDYVFGLMRESYRYLFRFSDGHLEEVRDVDLGGFGQVIYPLSPALRFSGALGYRRLSRTGIWNSDADIDEDIVSIQTALVFDDALWGSVGPRVGSRLSLVGEIAPSISGSAEYNTILMDLRNYLWVSRNVTFATRLALGTSWGRDAQNFYIGGAIPHRILWGEVETLSELIGFYTNYGDMLRGYDYASIYGRRYGVFSSELRIPFVNTLALDAPLPLTIRNGRGVVFFDLGTAFSDVSSFRGASTDGGFHLQDLKMGFGLGYRFNLGYFLFKHDIAWRTDLRGVSQKPVHNITLGAEF